jgi:hypothetical protein
MVNGPIVAPVVTVKSDATLHGTGTKFADGLIGFRRQLSA